MYDAKIHKVFLAEQEKFVVFGKAVCMALDDFVRKGDKKALMAIYVLSSEWQKANFEEMKSSALEACKHKLTAKEFRDQLEKEVHLVEKALYGAKCALQDYEDRFAK